MIRLVALALAPLANMAAAQPTPAKDPVFQPGETASMNYKTPVRSGQINGTGYSYRIDADGRITFGEVGEWTIRARTDEMTDKELWHIDHDEAHLMIFPSTSANTATFCVLGHDFPGRQAMVRIDARPAVTGYTDDCFMSARLFADLQGASSIRTRRYEWPEDIGRDETGDVTHFSDAMKLYRFMKTARLR